MTIRPAFRPIGAAGLLAATAMLTACGAPRPSTPGPVAGAELTEPDFAGAEAPPELLGGPNDGAVAAGDGWTLYPPGPPLAGAPAQPLGAFPPPSPVGEYASTQPDMDAPAVYPGGPVQPQPYGVAAGQVPAQPLSPEPPRAFADADVIGQPAMPKPYGRPPRAARQAPLADRPAPVPFAEAAPQPREYASADVIGRPAMPRSYGSPSASTLTDAPARSPLPFESDASRAPGGTGQPAPYGGGVSTAPMSGGMAPIPDNVRVAAAPAPMRLASATLPDAVTGPSANAPVIEPLPQARANAEASVATAPVSVPVAQASVEPVQRPVASTVRRAEPVTPPRPRTARSSERADASARVAPAQTPTTATTEAVASVPAATAGQRVSPRVWWALGLLALGLAAVAVMLGRGGRKERHGAMTLTEPGGGTSA